jgi:hypothetical protein
MLIGKSEHFARSAWRPLSACRVVRVVVGLKRTRSPRDVYRASAWLDAERVVGKLDIEGCQQKLS